MLKLAGCITLLLAGTVNGLGQLRCMSEFYNFFDTCEVMWGYHSSASLDFNVGDLFNITQLIHYCRTPNRMSVSSCSSGAYDTCTPNWPEEEFRLFREQNALQNASVEYLCSVDTVIEQNKECLEGMGGEITACARNAVLDYDSELRRVFSETSQSITWEIKKPLIERMGRIKESCVVELLKNGCNSQTANIMGNFFYATGVYLFDEPNKSH